MNSQCVLNITFGWHLVEEKDYSELKNSDDNEKNSP